MLRIIKSLIHTKSIFLLKVTYVTSSTMPHMKCFWCLSKAQGNYYHRLIKLWRKTNTLECTELDMQISAITHKPPPVTQLS